MQRELPPDAGALAGPEGLVRVRGAGRLRLGVEARGVEELRVVAPHRVPVQEWREDRDALPGAQRVPPAEQGVLAGLARERGRRGPQPQRLVEHLADPAEPADVLERRVGVRRVAPQLVDLALGESQGDRVLQQVVQGERQGAGGRLVPGYEEGDDLVADVGRVQGAAVGGVRGAEHQAEEVVGTGVAGGRAGADHVVHDAGEERRVAAERLVLGRVVGVGVAAHLVHRPVQAAHHRAHEGVRLGTDEGLEVVVETGQADRVEGHPRHVLGHVHGRAPARGPVPGLDQPPGDLHHRRVVGPHRAEGERRHQDVVRPGPVRLVVVRGEEAVGGELADVLQCRAHVLGEAFLVRKLRHQVEGGDDEPLRAVQPAPEDRPVPAGQAQQLLEGGVGGPDGGHVHDGDAGRAGVCRNGHVLSLAAPPSAAGTPNCMIVQLLAVRRPCAGGGHAYGRGAGDMDCDEYFAWRNYFLMLLDRLPLPVAICRADGEITVVNPAMAAEWGTAPGQVRGRNLLDLFTPSDSAADQLGRLIDALRLGRRSRYTIDVRWPSGAADGAQREGELIVEPVGEPSPTYPALLTVLRVRAAAEPEPVAEVSDIEGRILALAAAGATTAAIGKAVGLTVDGVNYHLTRLSRRWRVPNRTALVAKAYVLGVLAPGQWPPARRRAD